MTQGWEYKLFELEILHSHEEFERVMNRLGADEWELVNVLTAAGCWCFFFKRPVEL